MRSLYIFLDESGNFTFSPNGTKYLFLGAVVTERPFQWSIELDEIKYNIIEEGEGLEFFHCTEDKQSVRDQVFKIINGHLQQIAIHSIIVEKRKTNPFH